MTLRVLVPSLALLFFNALVLAEAYPQKLSLNGEWFATTQPQQVDTVNWNELGEKPWQPVMVPGHALKSGLADTHTYFFAREFDIAQNQQQLVQLCFDGADYIASVWLNGRYLGNHEGYFQPFKMLIENPWLRQQRNQLFIKLEAPIDTDSLNKKTIKGVLSHHDTRPGGAWTPEGLQQTTAGLWGEVYLKISKRVAIQDWHFHYELDPNTAQIEGSAQVNIFSASKKKRLVDVVFELQPYNFFEAKPRLVTLRKRFLNFGINAFSISNLKREVSMWWPYELGTPHLYMARIKVLYRDQQLDDSSHRLGFRKIENDPKTQIWRINGKRMFIRGTNYIGTIYLAEMTSSLARKDVSLMKQAHINAVRVHAHIAAPTFYEVCDEEGMLIWQDFPLQWGYEDTPAFQNSALNQIQDMVLVLNHHPSIFTWCPHNEPPWDAAWMTYKYKNYKPNQNKTLDKALNETLGRLDKTRYVHPHSATEEHPWLGWYSGSWRAYGKPTNIAIISEFGSQALPNEPSLRRIFKPEYLFPNSKKAWKKWDYHNFQFRESFEIAGIQKGKTLTEFIDNTQTYQSQLIKKAAESYRLQRYEPVSGIFQFMFVEHWPSINWGIVDFLREPKPGWKALKLAYQPLLPLIHNPSELLTSEINPKTVDVWVINDLHQHFSELQLVLTIPTAPEKQWQKTWDLTLGPDEKKKIATLTLPDLGTGHFEIWLQLQTRSGEVLAVNDWPYVQTIKEAM